MAKGAEFISGSFTIPSNDTSFTFDFGKTFNKYLYVIELADDSKTALMNSGVTGDRLYGAVGVYPQLAIGNVGIDNYGLAYRIKPASATSTPIASYSIFTEITGSSMTVRVGTINAGTYYLIQGYTYNYFIVEIK